MTAFLLLLYVVLFGWFLLVQWRRETQLQKIFFPALLIKAGAGIVLGLLYTTYYDVGDTFLFYNDSVLLARLARIDLSAYVQFLFTSEFPLDRMIPLTFHEPRSLFLVKFVSLICLVSFDNYWVVSVYSSVISFLGSWYLVKCIARSFPEATWPAVIAFLFVPSVTLWTSGLIKETFAMPCLYFLTGFFIRVWTNEKTQLVSWILVPIAGWMAWMLKYYFAAIFFVVVIGCLIFRVVSSRVPMKGKFASVMIGLMAFLIPAALMMFAHPNFSPHRIFTVIVENYHAFHLYSNHRNVITYSSLEPDLYHMLINAPWALISGLFRPFIWEADNLTGFLTAIENAVVLIVFLISLRNLSSLWNAAQKELLIALAVYVTLLCTFIALSTPNFGTLCRYRVSYFPFFIFLILLSPSISYVLKRTFDRFLKD